MAQINYAPFWKQETEAAAMPGVNEFGTKLFSNCRSNWAGVSSVVKVTSHKDSDSYGVSIGGTRASRTHAHLIEFGGARHHPQAPTVRAARALGVQINWQSRSG
jgi:hypothetical protein